VPGLQRKALVDDHGADIGVEHCGAEGILEAAGEYRLIDEGIGGAAQLAPLGGQVCPAGGRHAGHDQGLEIRAARRGVAEAGRQQFRHFGVGVRMRIPIAGMLAERARVQRLRNALGESQCTGGIAGSRPLLQRGHQPRAGIGVIFLGDRKLGQFLLEAGAIARPARPGLGRLEQAPPLVRPGTGAREELIDPPFLCLLCHGCSPGAEACGCGSVGSGARASLDLNQAARPRSDA
jgi:hypothetical protein